MSNQPIGHEPTPEINLSDFCYKFIDANLDYFDLSKPEYGKEHSLAIDKLEEYGNSQSCGKDYFKFMASIYKKSKYINVKTFIRTYTNAILQLSIFINYANVVFLLPLEGSELTVDKSNFYFSLYFMYLYREITNKKLENIYHIITDQDHPFSKHKHQIDLDNVFSKLQEGSKTTKENVLVFCDDFSYSGTQIVQYMNNINTTKDVELFLVISGLTISAKSLITAYTSKYRKNINIFLPEDIYTDAYDNTLENAIIDTISEDKQEIQGFDKDIADNYKDYWLLMNDMFIISRYGDGRLFANRQSQKLGSPRQTLTYLFFKYPDAFSTIQTMCQIEDYSNSYTLLYKNLTKEQKIASHAWREGFEIKPDLIGQEHYTFLLNNFENKPLMSNYIKKNLSNLIEECDPTLHIVDLAKCDGAEKTTCGGRCNDCCWKPFYKSLVKEPPFKQFAYTLSLTIGSYYSKDYEVPYYDIESLYNIQFPRPRDYRRQKIKRYPDYYLSTSEPALEKPAPIIRLIPDEDQRAFDQDIEYQMQPTGSPDDGWSKAFKDSSFIAGGSRKANRSRKCRKHQRKTKRKKRRSNRRKPNKNKF